MKKNALVLSVLSLAFFYSCGDSNTHQEHTGTQQEVEEDIPASRKGKIDPVCDMVYASTWEDFSVVSEDTVWFCSATCKEMFDGDPVRFGY